MTLADFHSRYPKDIVQFAHALWGMIIDLSPDVVETLGNENLGFETGYRDTVLVITPHKAHIAFGIARGHSWRILPASWRVRAKFIAM
jgi:hypothetical protein